MTMEGKDFKLVAGVRLRERRKERKRAERRALRGKGNQVPSKFGGIKIGKMGESKLETRERI